MTQKFVRLGKQNINKLKLMKDMYNLKSMDCVLDKVLPDIKPPEIIEKKEYEEKKKYKYAFPRI